MWKLSRGPRVWSFSESFEIARPFFNYPVLCYFFLQQKEITRAFRCDCAFAIVNRLKYPLHANYFLMKCFIKSFPYIFPDPTFDELLRKRSYSLEGIALKPPCDFPGQFIEEMHLRVKLNAVDPNNDLGANVEYIFNRTLRWHLWASPDRVRSPLASGHDLAFWMKSVVRE